MSEKNGKVCCNCRRCKRVKEKEHVSCYCEIDNQYLSYITVMSYWCRYWAKVNRSDQEVLNTDKDHEAFCRAKEAIETLNNLGGTVYRDESCPNKTRCYDYIGYHCATCRFSPKIQRGEADNDSKRTY